MEVIDRTSSHMQTEVCESLGSRAVNSHFKLPNETAQMKLELTVSLSSDITLPVGGLSLVSLLRYLCIRLSLCNSGRK